MSSASESTIWIAASLPFNLAESLPCPGLTLKLWSSGAGSLIPSAANAGTGAGGGPAAEAAVVDAAESEGMAAAVVVAGTDTEKKIEARVHE